MTTTTKYTQLVQPNYDIESGAGYSLAHVQNMFGAPLRHHTSWEAWQATKHKHINEPFPDAKVPVWFFSSFMIDGNFKNVGHTLMWDPEKQMLIGPPIAGYGKRWYYLEDVTTTRRSGGQTILVGWSEDINGLRVVKPK